MGSPCNPTSLGGSDNTSEINTNTCGSDTSACQTPIDPCGTDRSCDNAPPAAPLPYYLCTPTCEEDHTKNTYINQYYTTLVISNQWNVPDCSESVIVTIPNLRNLLVNSYFWSPVYGYFQVIAVNISTSQVTLQNNCNDGNASVGSSIPACTGFMVAPPPSDSDTGQPSIYPYVALDFTAPANGNCILITVTNVNGLSVGKNVQIGSGTYRVSGINSATTITICNDGLGITPGTPVIAKNAAGEYQYPVILIDSNPCTNAASDVGSLLVCNAGLSQPLHGSGVGMVPVLQNTTTNVVEFELLDIPTRVCTELVSQIVLNPAVTSYTFSVADSSEFNVGDVIQIGSRTERFTITSIDDATHFTADIDALPAAIEDIEPPQAICIIGCCEALQNEVTTINETIVIIEDDIGNLYTNVFSSTSAGVTPGSVYDGVSADGNVASFTIANASSHAMAIFLTRDYYWNGQATIADQILALQLYFIALSDATTGAIGAAPAPVPTVQYTQAISGVAVDGGPWDYSHAYSQSGIVYIAAGQEAKIAAKVRVTAVSGEVNNIYAYTMLRTVINAIAVAV